MVITSYNNEKVIPTLNYYSRNMLIVVLFPSWKTKMFVTDRNVKSRKFTRVEASGTRSGRGEGVICEKRTGEKKIEKI